MTPSARDIEDWLVARVSAATGLPPAEVGVDEPVVRFGLDSVAVVTLAADLEKWLGYRFRANPLDDHPTIADLARFLAGELGTGDRPG
jgi:phthiocerol/phenolphthiocerol synthesis type-I polyketide synthase D